MDNSNFVPHLFRITKILLLTVAYSLYIHLENLYYLIFGGPKKIITGQLVLITGGGNGIGKAIAVELAKQHKCDIVIADIDLKAAESTVEEVQKYDVKAKAYQVDVSNYEEVEKLATNIYRDLRPIDILINNAGLLTRGKFLDHDLEGIQKTIQVNFLSYVWTTRLFLPKMIERKKGHIVAIASVLGLNGGPFGTIYSGTKFAVTGFMESLAYELALYNQDYIKTTTIFPFAISTSTDLVDFFNKHNYTYYIPMLTPEFMAKEVVNSIIGEKMRVVIPPILGPMLFLRNLVPFKADIFTTKIMTTTKV